MEIDGREWLFYEAIPVDVAILRGTTADPDGNISMEREALILDNLAIAMAAKASKGFVIAQVERLAAMDALPARQVVVPGALVDCVVLAPPEHHVQTYATAYSPAFSGQLRVPMDRIPPLPWTSGRSSPAAAPWSFPWAAWSIWASACPRPWPPWRGRRTCWIR